METTSTEAVQWDSNRRLVIYGDKTAYLTDQQGQVWSRIARRRGVVSHSEIETIIDSDGELADTRRQKQVIVSRINSKLREAQIPASIRCVWGSGYTIPSDVKFIQESDTITIGPDQRRMIRKLIAACRDPVLAEAATQEFIDRK